MAGELKPCPFCGKPAELEQTERHGANWSPGCTDSECIAYQMFDDFPTKREAIAAWNRRAQEDRP